MNIIIENWGIVQETNPYTAPELLRSYLHGNVMNHPNFENGKEITTSAIVGINQELVVTASGSNYALGVPHPDYEKLFPDAKQRVLKQLLSNNS